MEQMTGLSFHPLTGILFISTWVKMVAAVRVVSSFPSLNRDSLHFYLGWVNALMDMLFAFPSLNRDSLHFYEKEDDTETITEFLRFHPLTGILFISTWRVG